MGEKKRRRAAAAARGQGPESEALQYAERARTRFAQSAFGPALEAMVRALELAPESDSLWAQWGELIRFYSFRHPVEPRLGNLLARALAHPAVDPGDLVRPIGSIALSRPDAEVLSEPLLLRLMQDTVVRDARLESVVAGARRAALNGASPPLDVLLAVAHQCFNTEYVLDESEAESWQIERLKSALDAPTDQRAYALYAGYRSLGTLGRAAAIAEELADTPLAPLARRQIVEPAEELRLTAGIPRLTAPAGPVSKAVQAQYEANPYPRWMRVQTVHAVDSLEDRPAPSRILIAGCGTGQHAVTTARRFPNSRVLAIDLSLASLAYAKRKTLELGVPNIEYAQADILALDTLGERFGLVEASGVLHHMAEPFAGWRTLARLVEPGGFMRIGLYSERGRRHVVRARALIAEHGLQPTPEGIRRCRALIRARSDDELLGRFARSEDFYSMSGCRDLLFHVQEHRFELPQIEDMIARLGLAFLGFEFPDSGITASRYRARFPDDAAMRRLDNWHRFEQDYPDSFARMYQFWVRKPA